MEEYEASIRCRFPRVVLVQARTPLPDEGREAFEAFLVPSDRVEEFRAFVAEDLAALAKRRGRPGPVVVVHTANPDRADASSDFR